MLLSLQIMRGREAYFFVTDMTEGVGMTMPDEKQMTMPDEKQPKKPGAVWKRILKWFGIGVGCIVGLILIVLTLIVWILSPAKLTPIVEKHASEMLNANVKLERVELTFWSTFPELTVDVAKLGVVSRALDGVADSVRRQLPADADSLLTLKRFHGGINLMPLLVGNISLHDVEIEGLSANLVQVNDSTANFLIMPATDEAPDTTALQLPHISINRFCIAEAAPLRYRSLADSLDVTLRLHKLDITDKGAPTYQLECESNVESPLLEALNFDGLIFSANGRVDWDSERPMAVALSDFDVTIDRYTAHVDTKIDFTDVPMVEQFSALIRDLPVEDVLKHVPEEFRAYTSPLHTNMTATLRAELTAPWNMADSLIPSMNASIVVPACEVTYDKLHFKSFALDMDVAVDGTDMNASVLNLKRLMTRGQVADFDLTAKVTNALADPNISGTFNGMVRFDNLPQALLEQIHGTIRGTLTGKTNFALRRSDLTRENFHRLTAKGELELTNFDADIDSVGSAYIRQAVLEFGSNSRFVADDRHTVDSLLTVSLKIDTLAAAADGIDVRLSGLRAGVGTLNRAGSADTTEINPFGMKIAVERLNFDSPADTLRMRLRNASIAGALRRYKGDAKLPQLGLKVAADRLMAGMALNRISLNRADMTLDLHKRPERQHANRQRADRSRREGATRSGHTAPQRRATLAAGSHAGEETMKFDMDSTERAFLRNWDFSGRITARGGRMATPAFPLRNTLRHIDLRFTPDSVTLDSLRYRAGQSDFMVNGSITNLRSALLGRRNAALGMSLSVRSDTLNVNEIVKALFAGTAVSQSTDSTMIWTDSDDVDTRLDQMADTATTGPLLIPHNIDARLSVRAKNVLYSDLILHNLRGSLMVYDGAINLRNLSAQTDIGSISLDGLYEGARPDSLQFGMGMKVSNFKLDRLTTIVPAIDSLMPMMQNFAGIVNADVAVTTDLTEQMDIDIPSLRAAIKIEGDSLVLLDPDTFKTLSKWLLFRNKDRNMIDHMDVEVVIDNSMIELYPFMFNIDRYRLGVMGSNDLAMNMNYHVSVLKSPIPFKFGINIKGTPDKMKIRLGGAKVKENMVVERQSIATDTRINIVDQINNVFRRGISSARNGRLSFSEARKGTGAAEREAMESMDHEEAMSYQDSLQFIRQGLIENPDTLRFPVGEMQ